MTAHGRVVRSIAPGLAVCVAAVSLACGEEPEPGGERGRVCTQIGCRSGVAVEFEALPGGAVDVRACVARRCRTAPADTSSFVFVPLPDRVRARRVKVRVVVRSRAGERLGAAERRVRLARVRPNGPRCPPVCFTARLRYDGDTGRLVPAPRPDRESRGRGDAAGLSDC